MDVIVNIVVCSRSALVCGGVMCVRVCVRGYQKNERSLGFKKFSNPDSAAPTRLVNSRKKTRLENQTCVYRSTRTRTVAQVRHRGVAEDRKKCSWTRYDQAEANSTLCVLLGKSCLQRDNSCAELAPTVYEAVMIAGESQVAGQTRKCTRVYQTHLLPP